MKGEVVYFRLHHIGASVDMDAVKKHVKLPLWAKSIAKEKAAPRYFDFPRPVVLMMDVKSVETNMGKMTFQMVAKLFSVGAISIMLRTPFEATDLRELHPFSGLKVLQNGNEVDLDVLTSKIVESLYQEIKPFCKNSYQVQSPPEPYVAYCVVESDTAARQWVRTKRKEISGLLAGDPHPLRLSAEEVKDTWHYWFSYYEDDLVVIEWDAPLVYEPSGKYEDILAVFEVANLQLLEMRTYDLYLDTVLNKAYDDLETFFSRRGILKSGRNMLKEIGRVRMDLAEMSDVVENISKFFGDWFLAKVYRGCSQKFELEAWSRVLNDKLQALSKIYQTVQEETEARRMYWLEVAIVALFIFDVALILTGK